LVPDTALNVHIGFYAAMVKPVTTVNASPYLQAYVSPFEAYHCIAET